MNPNYTKYILEIIDLWCARGWLRAIDRAFVVFMKEISIELSKESESYSYDSSDFALTLLAGALTSHQLGRGHVCLDIKTFVNDPDYALSLPPEGEAGEAMPPKPSEIISKIMDSSNPEISQKILENALIQNNLLVQNIVKYQNEISSNELYLNSGNTPLVFDNSRLYLRKYWQYTQDVAAAIKKRLLISFDIPEDLPKRIDNLFYSLRTLEENEKKSIHWQSIAAAVAAKSCFTIISGGPGTGKTTTVIQILALVQTIAMEQGKTLKISLAAPTGKAAARLTESIGNASINFSHDIRQYLPNKVTTIHHLLGSRQDSRNFIYNEQNKLNLDILVVDEASMVDLEMMADLLAAMPDKAPLILLGDKDQLASVEAGSVLGDLCRNADKNCYNNKTISWIQQYTGYLLPETGGTYNHLDYDYAKPDTVIAEINHDNIDKIDNNLNNIRLIDNDLNNIRLIDNDLNNIRLSDQNLDQNIVVLRKSHRFDNKSGIGLLAHAVNRGDSAETKELITKTLNDLSSAAVETKGFIPETFHDISSLSIENIGDKKFENLILNSAYCSYLNMILDFKAELSDKYLDEHKKNSLIRDILNEFAKFQILTPLRKGMYGVENLNKKIADILYKKRLISETKGWYIGRPVMIIRNDYNLNLMNGDIGIVLQIMDSLRVVFPMADGSLKAILPSRLSDIETVYAMTVHKSQGSEFDHTAMILPDTMSPVLTRELIYTGITRAKNRFTLITSKINILVEAVKRRTHRASGLGDILFKSDC